MEHKKLNPNRPAGEIVRYPEPKHPEKLAVVFFSRGRRYLNIHVAKDVTLKAGDFLYLFPNRSEFLVGIRRDLMRGI